MPAPQRSKRLDRTTLSSALKPLKPILFSESARPTSLPPQIRHIAWSPTGAAIANTLSSSIRIWNPEKPSKAASQELKGHIGTVEKVVWNPVRENELASTGSDGTVKIWDVRVGSVPGSGKGQAVCDVKVGDGGLFLAWHPEGREMLVGRRDDVLVPIDVRMGVMTGIGTEGLEAKEGKRLSLVQQTNQCSFSNSGREVFATMGDGTVRVLDWPSMAVLGTLKGHTTAALSVQHSPNGSCVAVGGTDSLVTLWDTTDWICKNTVSGGSGGVHHISFNFDGSYLVTGHGSDKDAEKGIDVIQVETTEVVHTFETQYAASVVAWHPLRYWLAYAGDPGGLKIVGVGSNL